ncbi:MAG: SPOR domain-containing protein [Arenicella sp.]
MISMYFCKRLLIVFSILLLAFSKLLPAQTVFNDEKSPTSVKQKELQDLSDFVVDVMQKNTKLRVQNSQNLFQKIVRKPNVGQLPSAMYKSLGYQTRAPFIAMPPELSTRLYQEDGNHLLNVRVLHELQKNWALLDSTRARILHADNWQETIVKQNVALDAINVWYRMANQKLYKTWLFELKKEVAEESESLSFNREQYSDDLFNKANIKLLEMDSDNATMAQFLNSESAYLYLRTDSRELPAAQTSRNYDFNNEYFCQADAKKMQVGNIYLQAKFPKTTSVLNNNENFNEVWRLTEVAKQISKELLASPNDEQLLAANYFLSDTILMLILRINQVRFNTFSENAEPFFISEKNQRIESLKLKKLSDYIQFQNTLFNLVLKDHFIARERTSFGRLALFRGCVNNTSNTKEIDLESFIQTIEGRYFTGLDVLQMRRVNSEILSVSQRWENSRFHDEKVVDAAIAQQGEKSQNVETVVAKPSPKIAHIKPVEKEQVKANSQTFNRYQNAPKTQTKGANESALKTLVKPDSIIGATPEQAFEWLKNEGFHLSSYEEMKALTENKGYSIQVLTTSSPSEAAFIARRFSKRDEVRVYLSSVTIKGAVEMRYKVLVTFFTGRVSAKKFQELVAATEQRQGFLKRYRLIRKDIYR